MSVPVFAIAGNHDDSGGDASLCPNDILAATGLINHFGGVTQNDQITVTPLLLRKGSTNLALYGLCNVRDERLFRTFSYGNVEFLRPEDDQEWFSLMAVHQNRTSHTETSYLPSHFLPQFLDMIVWGHEHECISEPERVPDRGFDILQVGSSVATSLCQAETRPKHAFILCITGKSYVLEKIPLKTVRPFVMKDVILSNSGIAPGRDAWTKVSKYLSVHIDKLIAKATSQWLVDNAYTEDDVQADSGVTPPLPLIRLRVEYSGGYEVGNPRRFSNQFVDRVANVNDVVSFYKKKTQEVKEPTSTSKKKRDVHPLAADRLALDTFKVQALVEDALEDNSMGLLLESDMGLAVAAFVDKDEKDAVKELVDKSVKSLTDELMQIEDLNEHNIMEYMAAAKEKATRDKGKEVLPPGSEDLIESDPAVSKRPRVPTPDNYVDSVAAARGVSPMGSRGRGGGTAARGRGGGVVFDHGAAIPRQRAKPRTNPGGPVIRRAAPVSHFSEEVTHSMLFPRKAPQPRSQIESQTGSQTEPYEVSSDEDTGMFRFSQPYSQPIVPLAREQAAETNPQQTPQPAPKPVIRLEIEPAARSVPRSAQQTFPRPPLQPIIEIFSQESINRPPPVIRKFPEPQPVPQVVRRAPSRSDLPLKIRYDRQIDSLDSFVPESSQEREPDVHGVENDDVLLVIESDEESERPVVPSPAPAPRRTSKKPKAAARVTSGPGTKARTRAAARLSDKAHSSNQHSNSGRRRK